MIKGEFSSANENVISRLAAGWPEPHRLKAAILEPREETTSENVASPMTKENSIWESPASVGVVLCVWV